MFYRFCYRPHFRLVSLVATIATMCFTGFVMAFMVSKFGVRVVTLASGFMLSTGILMTSFARDIFAIYICYGVLAGRFFNSSHLTIVNDFLTKSIFVEQWIGFVIRS